VAGAPYQIADHDVYLPLIMQHREVPDRLSR
jgi:hypothetical protein